MHHAAVDLQAVPELVRDGIGYSQSEEVWVNHFEFDMSTICPVVSNLGNTETRTLAMLGINPRGKPTCEPVSRGRPQHSPSRNTDRKLKSRLRRQHLDFNTATLQG